MGTTFDKLQLQLATHHSQAAAATVQYEEYLSAIPHYSPVGILGASTCGVMLQAYDTRCTPPASVAMRLMPRGEFVSGATSLPLLHRDFEVRGDSIYLQREIVHTASLKHPFIMSLREVMLTPTHIGIAADFYAGGNLRKYLDSRPGGRLSEGEARWLFQQLAIGLQYCHSRGVASRNIKLENLLLEDDTQSRPLLKICDFGYSKHDMNSSAKTTVGGTAYWAPEVLLGTYCYNSKAVDVWEAGIVLHLLLFGASPFGDPSDPNFTSRVVKGYPDGGGWAPDDDTMSDACRDLLSRLLHADAEQRSTMDEVIQHLWFLQDLPAGAIDMNANVLAHATAGDAAREQAVAVAVHGLVEQAAEVGVEGDPVVSITL